MSIELVCDTDARMRAKKCPGKCLHTRRGCRLDWSRPMHPNARPRLPYNPHREFREETGVLVFYDVPPMDWATHPAPVSEGISSFLDYLENAQARADELHRMPYKEYLETEEWKILRRRVMQRAQLRCEWCGRPDQEWNVHHLTYERRGYENLTDLVLLCRACHAAEHGKTDEQGHRH